MERRKVVLVGGSRTAFCRSGTVFQDDMPQALLTEAVKGVVAKFQLKGKVVGDVALGGVINHSSDWNMAREVVLGSGLAYETPAFGIQRACGTSLEAAILIANKIALGQIDCGIAGGVDSLSNVPVVFKKSFATRLLKLSRTKTWGQKFSVLSGFSPKELLPAFPGVTEPRTGKSMGEHCELMAQEWQIQRRAQDELALASHKKAVQAFDEGFYDDLITPYRQVKRDNIARADTTIEKMAKLKPVFERSEKGTLTAANSTPLTDGGAAVFLCSEEYAKTNNLPIQAYFVDCEVAAIDIFTEGLLMAPAYAVPRMLLRNKLTLDSFDFYEIHEAFAAQVLCTLKAWESADFCKNKVGVPDALGTLDQSRMNIKGGSVALGHPFGATGARILATLGKILETNQAGRGLISVCTGGGMGVTAILERPKM